MSDLTLTTGDSTHVETPQTSTEVAETHQEEMVSKAELAKVLDQLHDLKRREKAAKTELESRDLQSMKDREEWQKIAELKEQEAAAANERANTLQENVTYATKYSAVKDAALKLGLRQEALADLDLVDLEDVLIERTSTGRTNVLGTEKFVQGLKASRPHWFGGNNLNINATNPQARQVASGEVTTESVHALYQKARSSGVKQDMVAYQTAHAELNKQRRR